MAQKPNYFVKIPSSNLEFRHPNQEEIQKLDFEYQGGIELMFWLSKLETDTLTKDLTLNALEEAFGSLNNVSEYPIAEYNSVWHATFGLTVVFAEQLRIDFGWKWILIEDCSSVDVGWSMMSVDEKFGINVEAGLLWKNHEQSAYQTDKILQHY